MSKSVWIHIIFGNACSTLGLWVEKIGGSEIFLILIPYLGPLVHSVVSETCVEWRNLGGFRSRVRCPCPQLAAAQWWEAAGRGISCSNYVRCIATLCL